MLEAKYLKRMINPVDLAELILGAPSKRKGNQLWYISPFRNETEPSFEVTPKAMHDFGSGTHYDIIGFMQELRSCSFKQACEELARLYGLTENEYENKRIRKYINEQIESKKRYRKEIEQWFTNLIIFAEELWDENEACIKALQDYDESLEILYSRQVFLGCLREDILAVDTFEDKEKLKKEIEKAGFPKWAKGHERYTLILGN